MADGPYHTERETWSSPLLQAVSRTPSGRGVHTAISQAALLSACVEAHVELGAFDLRALEWLSGWEPATVQVFVGLIGRAYEAGRRAGGPHV